MKKPLVALVGRPNVGKSSLFNRLVGQRKAVVSEIPGTTRDRLIDESDWNGVVFDVVDTGGLEVFRPKDAAIPANSPLEEGSRDFVPEIRLQAMLAIEEADVIVLVVDVLEGVTAADEEIAEILRRTASRCWSPPTKPIMSTRSQRRLRVLRAGLGRSVSRSRRCTARARAICSMRWSRRCRMRPPKITTPKTTRSRSPSSGGPMSAKARCSTSCSARSAPSSAR